MSEEAQQESGGQTSSSSSMVLVVVLWAPGPDTARVGRLCQTLTAVVALFTGG